MQPRFSAPDEYARFQSWHFDATTGRLSWTGEQATDRCIGVDDESAANVNVWSRQLSNGSVALVFVNAEEEEGKLSIHCGWNACLKATGLEESARLQVQNLIEEEPLRIVMASDGISTTCRGQGGSATLLVTPLQDAHAATII